MQMELQIVKILIRLLLGDLSDSGSALSAQAFLSENLESENLESYESRYEKTRFLHMRKQRRRSASC